MNQCTKQNIGANGVLSRSPIFEPWHVTVSWRRHVCWLLSHEILKPKGEGFPEPLSPCGDCSIHHPIGSSVPARALPSFPVGPPSGFHNPVAPLFEAPRREGGGPAHQPGRHRAAFPGPGIPQFDPPCVPVGPPFPPQSALPLVSESLKSSCLRFQRAGVGYVKWMEGSPVFSSSSW